MVFRTIVRLSRSNEAVLIPDVEQEMKETGTTII